MQNANDKYCDDCIYRGRISFNTPCCDYIFIEGKMRPCPPGTACTVKSTNREVKRQKKEKKKVLSFEQKQRKAQRDKAYREAKKAGNRKLCRFCGQEFTPTVENKLFCSKECARNKNAEDRKRWEKAKNEKRKAARRAAREKK